MKKFYALLNTVVVLLVIFWNYFSNTGVINGKTVGQISDQYANLFTPAGYAFAIWGIIFFELLVLVFGQLFTAFGKQAKLDSILQIGPWLSLANIGNALWLWFWLHESSSITVLIMLFILSSLLIIVIRLRIGMMAVSKFELYTVWWPISLYAGWITVATVANFSAHLAHIGWTIIFSELTWTIIMISVAGGINGYMLLKRNMKVFAGVGIWALLAIAARHWGDQLILQWTSLSWAVLLLVGIIYNVLKNRLIAN